jgi:hypothetical protein
MTSGDLLLLCTILAQRPGAIIQHKPARAKALPLAALESHT